ncbi:HU family DNA-binding protein [Chachezhania antarctica]|uniref:HU family DNA-binding protein n=1 Tax=Chachezhania antarctica TaxID=2340860 RepID=UPI000EB2D36D|nr:HU family DNA-binding protein [Chachezhania antarctica]|tara:strand:- start:9527 stop:9796 length:270 start_codon:yes stop_codon:yes gene_type:complete
MTTYTKTALIKDVAAEANLNQATVGTALDAILGKISERTAAGDKVAIPGFGKFETRTRAARTGRNPATGAPVEIPERTVLKFTPSKSSS